MPKHRFQILVWQNSKKYCVFSSCKLVSIKHTHPSRTLAVIKVLMWSLSYTEREKKDKKVNEVNEKENDKEGESKRVKVRKRGTVRPTDREECGKKENK